MLAKSLIDETILPAKTSDSATLALTWMDEHKISHYPIANNGNYLGLISEDDIYLCEAFDEPLGNQNLSLNNPYVFENQHIYEVLKIFSELQLTALPVIDNKKNYLGVISLKKLMHAVSKFASLDTPGAIIVLEINQNDYTLSEISQIVESNDAKILSLFVTPHDDSTKIEVSLKLNKMEINSLLQTFYRYNYHITHIITDQTDIDDLRDRYESLMKYLGI